MKDSPWTNNLEISAREKKWIWYHNVASYQEEFLNFYPPWRIYDETGTKSKSPIYQLMVEELVVMNVERAAVLLKAISKESFIVFTYLW